MAYPAIEAPSGLVPVNRLDGMPYAGATRQLKVASGYNTSIFNGDAVKIDGSTGTVVREAADAQMDVIGIFVGCSYTDPVLKYTIHSQYLPANTVASDIVAYVVDDPNVVFKVAVVSSGTTIGSMAQTDLGGNAQLVDNSGDTATGKSSVAVLDSTATTATLPVKVVAFVEETKDSSGGFTEALVKWNAGHQYTNTTGV
jgi:hypothetical protein